MSDCIKREDAKRELCEWATNLHDPRVLIKDDAMCVLDNIPAAEVEVIHKPTEGEFKRMAIQEGYEPVVHCKDCKRSGLTEVGKRFCSEPMGTCYGCIPVEDDFFCSGGVRKEKNI